MNRKRYDNKERGYTVIETMIAISLFIVVVMSGMSALMNANIVHLKSSNMRSIIDSLSFVLEDMSRNLRTGYNYRCVSSNSDLAAGNISVPKSGADCWGIAFETATGEDVNESGQKVYTDQWVYYIGSTGGGPVTIFKSVNGGASYVQLVPDEITIDAIATNIAVLGAESVGAGNSQQPLVNITLVGQISVPGKNLTTPFSLQTSVSQRLIDL